MIILLQCDQCDEHQPITKYDIENDATYISLSFTPAGILPPGWEVDDSDPYDLLFHCPSCTKSFKDFADKHGLEPNTPHTAPHPHSGASHASTESTHPDQNRP